MNNLLAQRARRRRCAVKSVLVLTLVGSVVVVPAYLHFSLAEADLRRALAEFEAQADDTRAARCQLELARAAAAGGDAKACQAWTSKAATLLRQIGRDDLVVPLEGVLQRKETPRH